MSITPTGRAVARTLLFLLFTVVSTTLLHAQEPPRVVYSRTFQGSVPPYFSVTVERTGKAVYNESKDPDNAEELQLEEALTKTIFEYAEKLDHFQKPLESGLKVANMGQKMFRWENGGQTSEAAFNYSLIEDAKALTNKMDSVAESVRLALELKREIKHDHLGVNATTMKMENAWIEHRLVGASLLVPVLEQVAESDVFIHMARERARKLAEALRSAAK
jgi:hypothetical protein